MLMPSFLASSGALSFAGDVEEVKHPLLDHLEGRVVGDVPGFDLLEGDPHRAGKGGEPSGMSPTTLGDQELGQFAGDAPSREWQVLVDGRADDRRSSRQGSRLLGWSSFAVGTEAA